MTKYLVTGGAGFIGSHCVDRLLERGDEVVVVDNFNDAYGADKKFTNLEHHLLPVKNPRFTLVKADIAILEELGPVFEEHRFDKLLHLAARAGVQPSFKDPIEFQRSNVKGTWNLLSIAKVHGVRDVVYASSSSVYGTNKDIPFRETDSVSNVISPYARTKVLTEQCAESYSYGSGAIRIAGLRFFTVYGPRNRPDMAMALFTKKINRGEPVYLRGPVGQTKRDWTYVDDIVSGVIGVLDNTERLECHEVFNIGSGRPVCVEDFVMCIAGALDKKAIIKRVPLPEGDVPITYADTSKLREFLPGWEPLTSVEEGIRKYIDWARDTRNL